jgi:aryl-alcohol dehydrogenase-like predicted oxidoreductase
VPYDVGVEAAQRVASFTPHGATTAQLALRWIVDQPGVSTVIPGARNAEQARANAAAADLPALDEDTLEGLRTVYDDAIRQHVHDRW